MAQVSPRSAKRKGLLANSQPERMSHTWNVLGICVNHWARSRVTLDPNAACDKSAAEPAPGSCKWHADAFE